MTLISFTPNLRAGFTLVEILVVVALIAVLMAVAVPATQGVRERAAVARGHAELALIAQALESYRRAYGDYPQTGDFAQASAMVTEPLSADHAQAKLFNALDGVFGPTLFAASDRLQGPRFLDVSKLTLESPPGALTENGELPGKTRQEIRTALLDPWGRRYLYYYKRASAPAAWVAPGYWLYSAGPDGLQQPPEAASGVASIGERASANADNVWGRVPR